MLNPYKSIPTLSIIILHQGLGGRRINHAPPFFYTFYIIFRTVLYANPNSRDKCSMVNPIRYNFFICSFLLQNKKTASSLDLRQYSFIKMCTRFFILQKPGRFRR